MGLGKTSIKLRGAEVGIEAVMLGVVTSIGGKLRLKIVAVDLSLTRRRLPVRI